MWTQWGGRGNNTKKSHRKTSEKIAISKVNIKMGFQKTSCADVNHSDPTQDRMLKWVFVISSNESMMKMKQYGQWPPLWPRITLQNILQKQLVEIRIWSTSEQEAVLNICCTGMNRSQTSTWKECTNYSSKCKTAIKSANKFRLTKTPWSESTSELYRPSNCCFSMKRLPTCADRGCHVVSMTDPSGRILSVF
jgi:hypothetical protein